MTIPRLVITRERQQGQVWAARLEAAGFPVLVLPLLRFEPLPVPENLDLATFDWILFTSPQGVRAFVESGLWPVSNRLGALGGGTSVTLGEVGLGDDLGARTADGAALARLFVERVQPPGRVLLPGAVRRMHEPRATLRQAGFEVTEIALYETVPVTAAELPPDPFLPDDIVFFCSPSTVAAFAGAWAVRPPCVAIGQTTAGVASEAGFSPLIADAPDLDAMVRASGLGPLPQPENPETES